MITYSDALSRDICGAGPVALQISSLEDRRWSGMVRFWATLGVGISVAAILVYALSGSRQIGTGITLAIVILIFAGLFGYVQLSKVADALKVPALQAIAGKAGLAYRDKGFDPPVFAEAHTLLFGNWLSSQVFTDLFSGTDENGKTFALYEAVLVRGRGRSTDILEASARAYLAAINRLRSLSKRETLVSPHAAV